MTQKSPNPFIVGDWIKRDEDFIGRADLIQKYLMLDRPFHWLIGARRMGKTSLLRYLQRQFQQRPDALPLFWDVSGANTAYDLKLSFLDCLDSASFDFEPKGFQIPIEQLENESLLDMLRWLIREASRKSRQLIFLIDEAEALFKVASHDSQFIQRFKAIVLNHPALHIILASNHGLAPFDALNSDHLLAPLLQSFLPPDYLTPWSIDDARQLISRCLVATADQDRIIQQTGCLPFLVQMVCFYYHDLGNLAQTFEHINQRNILDLFFRDDFHQLQQENCDVLAAIAEHEPIAFQSLTQMIHALAPQIEQRLAALDWLGFVNRDDNHNYGINNQFLRGWMRRHYLPSYQKSAHRNQDRHPSAGHQQVLIEFTDPLVKISLRQNDKPVYENHTMMSQNRSRFDGDAVHDLSTAKKLGQSLFHEIFGAFTAAAVQDFLSQDDRDRDFLLVENGQRSHWIPFEYLHNGQDFLALKHGLFRTKISNYQSQQPAPVFDAPLKILLFASNTPPDIAQVDNEILIVRDQFQRIARELQVELDITDMPSHQADYLTLMNLLQTNQFHIIHYAGHCRRDEDADSNLIYLREQAGNSGRVRAVAAQELSSLLNKNLLLFYLNTCHSALSDGNWQRPNHASFAEAILAAGAKAVIGNVTAVNDRLSAEFARDFYWQLFSSQFDLAKTLQMTRLKWSQQTRFQESSHVFWLAPVLWQN